MKGDPNTSVIINCVLHLTDRTTREKMIGLVEKNLHKFKKFRCSIEVLFTKLMHNDSYFAPQQPKRNNRFWEAIFGRPRPILKEMKFDADYHVTHDVLSKDENQDDPLRDLLNKLGSEVQN